MFLLQHGNYGEGPINPFMVSDSKDALLDKIQSIIPAEYLIDSKVYFDTGDCIHIRLAKDFWFSGFSYNMFFIDKIDKI